MQLSLVCLLFLIIWYVTPFFFLGSYYTFQTIPEQLATFSRKTLFFAENVAPHVPLKHSLSNLSWHLLGEYHSYHLTLLSPVNSSHLVPGIQSTGILWPVD